MALLMFVVLFGQQAWRKMKGNGPAPADGKLADNVVGQNNRADRGPAAAAKPADDDRLPPGDQLAQVPGVRPEDLKLPEVKPAAPIDGKRLFGGVSSKLFDVLQDDTIYRSDENGTFFALLKALREADERDVELASIGPKTFVQLYEQSPEYRGEIVTVGGVVERVIPQTNPPANSAGIKKYYEVWLRPDGGRLPIVAVCLDLPKDYPAGRQPHVDVSGYFYKRLGYPSAEPASGNANETGMKNVFRSSPLVLAKTLEVRSVAAAPNKIADDGVPEFLRGVPLPIPAKFVLPILGIGMIVAVGLSAWAFKMTKSSSLRGPIVGRNRKKQEEAEPTDLNSLRVEP
jgi:hypothetical protein